MDVLTLREVRGHHVQRLLLRLNRVLELPQDPPLEDLCTDELLPPLGSEIRNPPKHVLQERSILAHGARGGCFACADVVMELGAGTAKLSDQLQSLSAVAPTAGLLHDRSRCAIVLVDRQTFKCGATRDRSLSKAGPFQRFVQDLNGFDLKSAIPPSLPRPSLVLFSKHLCGPACDFVLKSARATLTWLNTPPPLLVATCCHHRCTFETYVNPEFFTRLGLDREDFAVCCTISQWATIKSDDDEGEDESDHSNDPDNFVSVGHGTCRCSCRCSLESTDSAQFERSLSRSAKRALGRLCKLLLDTGRAEFLAGLGYTGGVRLVRYTSASTDNMLLCAFQRPQE